MVDKCTAIGYQPSWGFQREPARPQNLRIDYCGGMKFDDNFDWSTAWYDAISVNDNVVLLIGPPLYDKKGWINLNVTFTDGNGVRLPVQFMDLDRVSYTALTTSKRLTKMKMTHGSATIDIVVNGNDGRFDGKKTMVTMQKNNPIEWIRQWIEYHGKVHGIDGFLIYDNGSTDYSANDLEQRLNDLPYQISVVEWPYPYGPQGSDHAPWDSDYGQYVMLEHAKYRYLSNAALVLNNDIDELIVTKDISIDDIMQYLKSSQSGCLGYKGIWIEPYDINKGVSASSIPFGQRHVRDYYCTDENNSTGIGYKWMLVPWKHMNNQWLVHRINAAMLESDQLYYAHHLAFNTNWSWKRDEYKGDVSNLKPEPYLIESLRKMDQQ